MLGTIGFEGYRVSCIIGTEQHERIQEQRIFIDLKVKTDFSKVALTENLKDTINYTTLAHLCKELAVNGKYFLIEKYAFDIIQQIFDNFPVKSAWVRIKKPTAINEAEWAFVELEREENL
jgi:dihydroneopterin aldolase